MAWNVFPKRLKDDLPPQQDNAPEAAPTPVEAEGGEQVREILESIEGVAYVWDVAAARYSYVSPQAEQIVGYPASDLIRPGFWLSRVHPADRIRFEHLQKTADSKTPGRTFEYRFLNTAGDFVWLRDQMKVTDREAGSFMYGLVINISARKRIESAIEASERRHRLMLEKMDVVPYSFDVLENRYTYIGGQISKLLQTGMQAWNFEGFRYQHVHDLDREQFDRDWGAACQDSRSGELEYRIVATNNDVLWVRDVFHFDTDGEGRKVAYGSIIDITAKRRAEEALRESQALLRSVIDAVPATISVKDLQGRYVLVNNAFAEFHDKPAVWFNGRTAGDLYSPEQLSQAEGREAEVIASGQPSALYENERQDADGHKTTWLASKAPLRDDAGNVKYVATVSVEITDRKLAEEKLHESERRFRHLVESTDIVPYTWDLQTRRYTYVGPQAEKLLGYPVSAWTGEGFWMSRLHPDDSLRAMAAARRLHDDKIGTSEEYRMIGKDDKPVWVRDIIDVEQQADGRHIAYGVMIDVSDSKRQTEALIQAQKMDIIGQMTGGVAHDFNNLLTVIIANLHMILASAPADAAMQRRLNMISQAAERSSELTKRLLAFSRRQTLMPKTTDVNGLVSGMTELLRRTLGSTIEIDLQLSADLWQSHVDPAQLESALVNLAVNARDAMRNSGRLDITTSNQILYADENKPEKPSGSFVMLAVRDSGCGMPPEVMKKIFEPFFTTKEVGKGTGLGLSMIYGFVSQSGGWVDVESEIDRGTVFKLYLPRAKVEAEQREEKVQEATAVEPEDKETVLCVEDDPQVRSTVRELLLTLGYAVREAENGASALMQLHLNKDIKLLFTDIVMPGGMSGAVLAKEAIRQRPELKVLYTSGYAKGHLDEEGIWLPKPYSPDDLARKVREALDASATIH
jgi:PAS domain S-box-containing protein